MNINWKREYSGSVTMTTVLIIFGLGTFRTFGTVTQDEPQDLQDAL